MRRLRAGRILRWAAVTWMSSLAVVACDDDEPSGAVGGTGVGPGNPSGGAGASAGAGGTGPGGDEGDLAPIIEGCCLADGSFRADDPTCEAFVAQYGLDNVDFCAVPWPPQTSRPDQPFADPVCGLDCSDVPAGFIVGCMTGVVGESFAIQGGALELAVLMGEPFGWTLRNVNPPTAESGISRFEFILAGPGALATGTYPLDMAGVAFVQAGYIRRTSSDPNEPTYFYKTEDLVAPGTFSMFTAPAAVGETGIGAFDFEVDASSYVTAEIADPMPAGNVRVQACFHKTAAPG